MVVQKGHRFGARQVADLTGQERSLIVGTLLGDSSISWGSGNRVSARVRVRHCLAQRDLVLWKYDLLERFVATPPKETPNRGYDPNGRAIGFSTRCYGDLAPIKCEYNRGALTDTLLSWLTDPIGLAAWFMDDGSRTRGSSLTIHTQGFHRAIVNKLACWLVAQWDVDCRAGPVKNRKYWVLRFPADSGERFMDLVRPFVTGITSMERKLRVERESLFCPMCGDRFTLGRRQLQRGKRLVTCRSKECVRKLVRLTARINDDRRSTSTT